MGTKSNPSKFDCYANAKPDEPMFVLLGRDPCAGVVIRFWAMLRMAIDIGNEEQIEEAFACAEQLESYAKGLGKEALVTKLKETLEQAEAQFTISSNLVPNKLQPKWKRTP